MKLNPDDLYWNPDHTKYAVLISPDYGAGWSTWISSEKNRVAWDKRLIEFFLSKDGGVEGGGKAWKSAIGHPRSQARKELNEILKQIGVSNPEFECLSGGYKAEIYWITPGTRWQVRVYDGAESVVKFDLNEWFEVKA